MCDSKRIKEVLRFRILTVGSRMRWTHWATTAFAPALHGLIALFGSHVLPALAPVVPAHAAAISATPTTARAEAAGKQAPQHHKAECLEKSKGRQAENCSCQVVPQQHRDESKCGKKQQSECNAFGCPFPFYHC